MSYQAQADCLPEIPPDVWPIDKKSAFWTLALSMMFLLLDFMDRQILAGLFPYIKEDFQLTDTQLGMLASIVNISITVMVIPTGYLVDRWSRKYMMGIMTFVWSLATGACALTGSYAHLLMARFFVGAGEAGYMPAAQSLLAASFPSRLRSTVLGIFLLAGSIGAPLGLIAGAVVANHWGWRHAFGLVAVPGILGALLCITLKDFKNVKKACEGSKTQPRVPSASSSSTNRDSFGAIISNSLRTPSLALLFVAFACCGVALGTIMNWMPSYFNRVGGMDPTRASVFTAALIIARACAGPLFGPVLDKLRTHGGVQMTRFLFVVLAASGLLFVAALTLATPGSAPQITLMFLSVFCTGCAGPGSYTIAADLSLPHHRATVLSMCTTSVNLLGMALGPLAAGVLSDALGLEASMTILCGFYGVAALLYLGISMNFQRDFARLDKVVVEF